MQLNSSGPLNSPTFPHTSLYCNISIHSILNGLLFAVYCLLKYRYISLELQLSFHFIFFMSAKQCWSMSSHPMPLKCNRVLLDACENMITNFILREENEHTTTCILTFLEGWGNKRWRWNQPHHKVCPNSCHCLRIYFSMMLEEERLGWKENS